MVKILWRINFKKYENEHKNRCMKCKLEWKSNYLYFLRQAFEVHVFYNAASMKKPKFDQILNSHIYLKKSDEETS